MTTRRLFLSLLAAPWLRGSSPAAPAARIVAYRVDAVIVLFSRPIFTRTDVGEGGLYFHEEGAADQRRLRLAFAAGSRPERARGLNRFGYFSESIRTAAGGPPEAQYFGFMTRADEKNLKEAERALHARGGGVPAVTISGEMHGGGHFSRLADVELEAGARWSVWPQCLAASARAFEQSAPAVAAPPRGPGAETFLLTLSRLLERTDPRGETPFLYGRNPRRLVWRRSPDPKASREFAARRLVEPGATVMRFDAETVDESKNSRSRFSLWHDPQTRPPLPLRIELQPRSFLRLRLELVQSDTSQLRAEMEHSFDAWLKPASAMLRSGV